ncbi:MAG: hypothetical protein C4297_14495 [Gemmataceae bacterium]
MASPPMALLHVHSFYSLLEGVDSPETLVRQAAAYGYAALALTDRNNLYGVVRFVEAARAEGIRPLVGACLAQGQRRCTVLVAEPAGYVSLCRILSRLHLDNDDLLEALVAEPQGLHVLLSERTFVPGASGRPELPAAGPGALREAFGTRLWVEVVRPRRRPDRERQLLEWGARWGLAAVASVPVYWATPAGRRVERLVRAIRQRTLLERTAAASPQVPVTHMPDRESLRALFRDLPGACVQTMQLAEACRSDVLPRGVVLPPARVPRSCSALAYLRALCTRGLRRRHLESSTAAQTRLEEELALIAERGLADYFLVVRDIAWQARRQGWPMALRGSAGNSLVCYVLGITDINPMQFGLELERFLHAGRPDLPDIDLDFDWKVRDAVLAAVCQRYGEAYTAMISSHLSLQPRSAFREAARAHGLSNAQITRLLEGLDRRIETLLQDEGPVGPTPREFADAPTQWAQLLADARTLLRRPHHLSIHPGGVVITPRPVRDYVPLERSAKGVVVTQFDKDGIEQIGLVKIDLLGNRALATLAEVRQACAAAAAGTWSDTEVQRAVALLQRGDTLGINQLESPAMRHLLVAMQPRGLEDIVRALALIRPGAAAIGARDLFLRRCRGLEPVRYPHPLLEPVLRDTYGLMLYEDDVLRVIQTLTGWTAPEADRLRKEATRAEASDADLLEVARTFLTACQRRGIPRTVAEAVWVQIAKFNRYSFCKSHAVSYGLIAWELALYKANRPLDFWVAALNNNQGMYPRWVYVEAIKHAGYDIRLPCVNRSARDFCREDQAIRTGLGAVAGLDETTREAVLAERGRRGPFASLSDFRRRIPCGPEALGRLIEVGAFDFTGQTRPELALEAELTGARTAAEQRACFFPWQCHLLQAYSWRPEDYTPWQRWQAEWNALGFLVGPPLMSLFRGTVPGDCVTSADLPGAVGRTVRVAGLVATYRHTPTETGQEMQFLTLADEQGLIEVALFPDLCRPVPYPTLGPYVVEGVVEERYGAVTVRARQIGLCRAPSAGTPQTSPRKHSAAQAEPDPG